MAHVSYGMERMFNSAYWVIFHVSLPSADFFFQNQLFVKILSGLPPMCQNSLDPDQTRRFAVLIWFQTVCKGYQQTTLVGKELKDTICIARL